MGYLPTGDPAAVGATRCAGDSFEVAQNVG